MEEEDLIEEASEEIEVPIEEGMIEEAIERSNNTDLQEE